MITHDAPIEIPSEFPTVVARSVAIIVTDDPSYRDATEALISIKSLRKKISEVFDPVIKSANETHKRVLAQKKKLEAGLVDAENALKAQISSYQEHIDALNKEAMRSVFATDEPEFCATLPASILVPQVDAIQTRILWKFRITDKMKFVRAVADGLIPIDAIVANDTFINGEIKERRSALGYPGVEVYTERSIAVSTKNA